MEIIHNMEELEQLVAAFKTKGRKTANNFYLLNDEIERLISQKRLYYVNNENCMQLLADEGEYYHLYWYLEMESGTDAVSLEVDKPVLFELVYREGRLREREQILLDHLEKSGFVLHAMNYEYEFGLDMLGEQQEVNDRIQYAAYEDMDAILMLWRQNLDMFVFPYVAEEEWKQAIDRREIVCVKNEQGDICGAQQFDIIGKKSIEHHVVTDKAMRGKGIGRLILQNWMQCAKERGCDKNICWIAEDNTASIRMHEKSGAKKTGKCSKQFVKM